MGMTGPTFLKPKLGHLTVICWTALNLEVSLGDTAELYVLTSRVVLPPVKPFCCDPPAAAKAIEAPVCLPR